MLARLTEVIGVLLFVFTLFSPTFIGLPVSVVLFVLSIILISHQQLTPYMQKERLLWFGRLFQEAALFSGAFILGVIAAKSSFGKSLTAVVSDTPFLILLVGVCAILGGYLAKRKDEAKSAPNK